MKVTFIVNGDDVPIDVDGDVPFDIVLELALDHSRNFARPLDDWEARDLYGLRIDSPETKRLRDFQPDSRMFLTLKVGAGGARRAA